MVAMPRAETLRNALENTAETASAAANAPSRRRLHRAALAIALLAATTAASRYGYEYWQTGRFQQSTDDLPGLWRFPRPLGSVDVVGCLCGDLEIL